MPSRELLEWTANGCVLDRVETLVEPTLETSKIGISAGEQPVMYEQFADVLTRGARRRAVDPLVSDGNGAVTESAQKQIDLRVAFPGVDALRAVRGGKDVDQLDAAGDGRDLARQEQRGEVVAEAAAGAQTLAVVLAFGAAAMTVEVGGDAGAGSAEPLAVVTAGQEPLSAALVAAAVGASGVMEADATDRAIGPADADLAGGAPAAVAGVGAGGARPAAWSALGRQRVSHHG